MLTLPSTDWKHVASQLNINMNIHLGLQLLGAELFWVLSTSFEGEEAECGAEHGVTPVVSSSSSSFTAEGKEGGSSLPPVAVPGRGGAASH